MQLTTRTRTFVLALVIMLVLLTGCGDPPGGVYDNSATSIPDVWRQENEMRKQVDKAPTVRPMR